VAEVHHVLKDGDGKPGDLSTGDAVDYQVMLLGGNLSHFPRAQLVHVCFNEDCLLPLTAENVVMAGPDETVLEDFFNCRNALTKTTANTFLRCAVEARHAHVCDWIACRARIPTGLIGADLLEATTRGGAGDHLRATTKFMKWSCG
jgi:hypothetical protein